MEGKGGGKRPCEDHPNSSSPTAIGGKRPCVDHPTSTSAAAGAEAAGLFSAYPYPSERPYDDYPGSYVFTVEEGRIVLKVDEYVITRRYGRTYDGDTPPKVVAGFSKGPVSVVKTSKGNLY